MVPEKMSDMCARMTAFEVRQKYLDFFMKNKSHIYVHSSSAFPNDDKESNGREWILKIFHYKFLVPCGIEPYNFKLRKLSFFRYTGTR
jgi:hypothetical protein